MLSFAVDTARIVQYVQQGLYIHLYSHKLQLQTQEIKKTKGKRDTQRVEEHSVSNAY